MGVFLLFLLSRRKKVHAAVKPTPVTTTPVKVYAPPTGEKKYSAFKGSSEGELVLLFEDVDVTGVNTLNALYSYLKQHAGKYKDVWIQIQKEQGTKFLMEVAAILEQLEKDTAGSGFTIDLV